MDGKVLLRIDRPQVPLEDKLTAERWFSSVEKLGIDHTISYLCGGPRDDFFYIQILFKDLEPMILMLQ